MVKKIDENTELSDYGLLYNDCILFLFKNLRFKTHFRNRKVYGIK